MCSFVAETSIHLSNSIDQIKSISRIPEVQDFGPALTPEVDIATADEL